jgi:hypothetical protein
MKAKEVSGGRAPCIRNLGLCGDKFVTRGKSMWYPVRKRTVPPLWETAMYNKLLSIDALHNESFWTRSLFELSFG